MLSSAVVVGVNLDPHAIANLSGVTLVAVTSAGVAPGWCEVCEVYDGLHGCAIDADVGF